MRRGKLDEVPSTKRSRTLLALLSVALLGGGCTGTESSEGGNAPAAEVTGTLADVPHIAAQLQPSVVTILTAGGSGSGVVYREDGLIVTNEHVVRDSAAVEVAFADGQRVAGTVLATDAVTDLALVEADRTGLPAAEFQRELPTIGDLAVVIGSPLGFQNTVTVGIISGLHRDIPGSATLSQALVDLIQTDAAISPGNSGGAVVDGNGQVIGISEAYIPPQAGAVSLGFAIPSATVIDVIEELEADGQAEHAFMGLEPAPITPAIAEQLGLPSTAGVIVRAAVAGGPAAIAGIQPGDVITAIEDEATASPEDLLAALRDRDPGDTVTVTLRGDDQQERDVDVTLTARPSTSE